MTDQRKKQSEIEMKTQVFTTQQTDIKNWLPRRKNGRDTNKYKFGHVIVFAGSRGFTGAPILTAEAAQRAGAGLVTIAIPEDLENSIVSRLCPVVMTCGLSGSLNSFFNTHSVEAALALTENATVAALGPGIGLGYDVSQFVLQFTERCLLPLVIDADALTILASMNDHGQSLIRNRKSATILTPHPTELARLLGTTTESIQNDRMSAIKQAVNYFNCVILLKGFHTLISDPSDQIYLNTTGNPGLSTAGSGDVLTGVIAGFLAQNLTATQSATAGAFVHGFAADLTATENGGTTGIIATDIISHLPNAISICQQTIN